MVVQTSIVVTAAIEATIVGAFTGMPVSALLGIIGASWTALITWRLRRPRPRTLKALRRVQVLWLTFAAIDLLLSVFLARRALPLAALGTRVALPIWIYTLARKESKNVVA